jgi:hypothetical protein
VHPSAASGSARAFSGLITRSGAEVSNGWRAASASKRRSASATSRRLRVATAMRAGCVLAREVAAEDEEQLLVDDQQLS